MFKKLVIVVVSASLLFGCNSVLLGRYGEQNQTLEAFTQRVENVFKFQNSMTNAVILMETEPSSMILDAEQKMQSVCEPLNEYASREMDGLSTDFTLQKRVEKTAISCEKAAQKLQTLLLSAH